MPRTDLTAAVLIALAVTACERPARRLAVAETAAAGAPSLGASACDSASAVRVALDSLGRLDPFRSAVRRFERDTAGFRMVTGPVDAGAWIDGMAVVRVGRDCRVRALAQTDSA